MRLILLFSLVFLFSCRSHFELYDADQGRQAILDESYETYFSEMRAREMAALRDDELSAEPLDRQRRDLKLLFQTFVEEFTEEEKRVLEELAVEVDEKLKQVFPLLAKVPWRILKVSNKCCKGYCHTRGEAIILSVRGIDRAVQAKRDSNGELWKKSLALMLHEKIHVAQRFYPEKFKRAYRDLWGFKYSRKIESSDLIEERAVHNPDALDLGYYVTLRDENYWPRTLLRDHQGRPRFGADFQGWLIPLNDDATQVIKGKIQPLDFPLYKRRFPPRAFQRGGDHPHEITAYALEQLLGWGPPLSQSDSIRLKEILGRWLRD